MSFSCLKYWVCQKVHLGFSIQCDEKPKWTFWATQYILFIYFSPPLPEKAMAPHSSTLAWKIPWMEEPGRLQSMGPLRVGHDWATSFSIFTFMHWRRKWQPTPVFSPENPRDGGAWWAAIHGVTQSRTWLKWLSSSSSPSPTISLVIYFSFRQICSCCSITQSCGLFVTPWTVACRASLSITIYWSLLKLMSTESGMPSNHLILWLKGERPFTKPRWKLCV